MDIRSVLRALALTALLAQSPACADEVVKKLSIWTVWIVLPELETKGSDLTGTSCGLLVSGFWP